MYCPYCSSPLPQGNSFCPSCDAPVVPANQPSAVFQKAPAGTLPEHVAQPGKKPGLWSSPGGIATIAFVAVFVIGGIVAGLIYAFTRSGNENYTQSIRNTWAQFNQVAGEVDEEMEPVLNLVSINSAGQIKDFRKLLNQKDEDLDKIMEDIKSLSPSDNEMSAYDNLARTVKSYQAYLKELDKFLGLFVINTNDIELESTLDKMSGFRSKIQENGETFIRLNPDITPSSFDPQALRLPSDYVTQLAIVRKTLSGKEQTETEQETVEAVSSARNSLENILSLYARKGWSAVVQYMTPALYAEYEKADPPWTKVSYTVDSASITNFQVIETDKIIFTVEEQHSEGDDVSNKNGNWEMVKTNGSWLLNNTPYTYN